MIIFNILSIFLQLKLCLTKTVYLIIIIYLFIFSESVCGEHIDCPDSKPACVGKICMNLCELKDMCGINAICKLQKRITPVCYCGGGMIGDPFVKCMKRK